MVIFVQKRLGICKDYIEGMYKIITHETADDYVLATGVCYTIKDFCDISAKYLDIDLVWDGKGINTKGINNKNGKTIIEIDKDFIDHQKLII